MGIGNHSIEWLGTTIKQNSYAFSSPQLWFGVISESWKGTANHL